MMASKWWDYAMNTIQMQLKVHFFWQTKTQSPPNPNATLRVPFQHCSPLFLTERSLVHKYWLNTAEVLKSHHWVLNALCLAQDICVHVENERKTKELIEAHRHSWGHVLQRTTISFRKVKPGLRSSQVLNQAILLPKGHAWRLFVVTTKEEAL